MFPTQDCFWLICTVVGNTWLAYSRHYAWIQTLAPFDLFSSTWIPSPLAEVLGSTLGTPHQPLWSPSCEDIHFQVAMGWLQNHNFWETW